MQYAICNMAAAKAEPMLVRRLLMFWRIMVAGGRNFIRNAWLSVAAIAVMAVTLSSILGAVVFNMALSDTLDRLTGNIDIAVFFEDTAAENQITALQTELEGLDNVKRVHFVSKTEALARYRAENAGNQDVLEAVSETDNPLPPSLEIRVLDLGQLQEIENIVRAERFLPLIEDTNLGQERRATIDRIAATKSFLLSGGIAASLLFAAISVLIIFNTIRLAIFSRADEIQIMRLIGTTNGFIRGPFLFEAMLDGIIAALLALGVVYAGLLRGAPVLINYEINLEPTLALFNGQWPLVVALTLAGGILLGVLSSLLAMARYLKL